MQKISMINKLERYAPLRHKISIYVPGTFGVDTAADTSAYVRKAAEFLSTLYGGATSMQSTGYWVSDASGLVEERTTIVYAFCKSLDSAELDQIVDFCVKMKTDLMQEAVSLEINNQLYLI